MEETQANLDPNSVADQEKLILTESYLEYFRTIQISGDRHKFAYRKNDNKRRTSYIESPEAAKELFYDRPVLMTGAPDQPAEPARIRQPVVIEKKTQSPFQLIVIPSGNRPAIIELEKTKLSKTLPASVFPVIYLSGAKPEPQYA